MFVMQVLYLSCVAREAFALQVTSSFSRLKVSNRQKPQRLPSMVEV